MASTILASRQVPVGGGGAGSVYITGTAIFSFNSEDDTTVVTVTNTTLKNSTFAGITFVPVDTVSTSISDFYLNGVTFNIENIVDNTSFDLRAAAINNATGDYTVGYIIQLMASAVGTNLDSILAATDTLYNKIADNIDPYLYVNTKDEINAFLKDKANLISPTLYHSLAATRYSGTISTSGTAITNSTTDFGWELIGARLYIGTEYRTVVNLTDNQHITVDTPFSSNYAAGTAFNVYFQCLQFSNSVVGQYVMFKILDNNGNIVIGHGYDRVTIGDNYKFGDPNNNCAFTPGGTNAFQLGADKFIQWYDALSSGDNALAGNPDVGFRRNTVGVGEIFDGVKTHDDGTLANRRDFLVRKITSSQSTNLVQTSAITTGAISVDLNSGSLLNITTALTGNVTLSITNPADGASSRIFFTQGSTARTFTLSLTSCVFRQTGTTGTGTSTYSVQNISTINAYYEIELNWVSSTLCYVTVK